MKGMRLESGIAGSRIVFGLLLTGLLTPMIIDRLGDQAYGLWTLAFSVLGWLGLLDLGTGTATIRLVGEAADDHRLRDDRVAALLLVSVALSLIGAFAVGLVGVWLPRILESSGDSAMLRNLLWLLGLRAVVLNFPLGTIRGLLFASDGIIAVHATQSMGTLTWGVSAWLALSLDGGLLSLAAANLVGLLVEWLIVMALVVRRQLWPRQWRRPRLGDMRDIASIGLAQGLINISALVLFRTDPLILASVATLVAVAHYALALKIAEALMMVIKQTANIIAPRAARATGLDRTRLAALLLEGSRFATVVAVAVCGPVLILAEPLLMTWVGADFAAAAPILQILTLAALFAAPELIASSILAMTGEHTLVAKAALIRSGVNVALSVPMALLIGPVGVACATFTAAILVDPWLIWRRVCQRCGVQPGTWLTTIAGPLPLPILFAFGVPIGGRLLIEVDSLIEISLLCVLGAAPALLAGLGLERRRLRPEPV